MSHAVIVEDSETIWAHNRLISGSKVEIEVLSDFLNAIQNVSSLEEIKEKLAARWTELVRNKERKLIAELKSQMPRIPENDMQAVINGDVKIWLASDPEMQLIQHLDDLILEEGKRTNK